MRYKDPKTFADFRWYDRIIVALIIAFIVIAQVVAATAVVIFFLGLGSGAWFGA